MDEHYKLPVDDTPFVDFTSDENVRVCLVFNEKMKLVHIFVGATRLSVETALKAHYGIKGSFDRWMGARRYRTEWF